MRTVGSTLPKLARISKALRSRPPVGVGAGAGRPPALDAGRTLWFELGLGHFTCAPPRGVLVRPTCPLVKSSR